MSGEGNSKVETRLQSLQDTVDQLRLALQDAQGRNRSPSLSPKSKDLESGLQSWRSAPERQPTDWKRMYEMEKLKVTERDRKLSSALKLEEIVSSLHREIEDIYTEKQSLELEIGRLQDVERQNEGLQRQLAALQSTLAQKERILREVDIERTEEKVENQALRRKIGELERDTMKGSQGHDNLRSQERLRRAEAEVKKLTMENEELSLRLHQFSIDRGDEADEALKEKIANLEKDVENLCSERERLLSLLNDHETETVRSLQSTIREKQLVIEGLRNPATSPPLRRIAERLGVAEDEAETAVEEMVREMQYRRKAAITVERIGQLMQDCLMSDIRPDVKEVWRWVRRITEEFMNVTQHYRNLSTLINEVCDELGVSNPKEVRQALSSLLKEARSTRRDSDFQASLDE